MVADWQMTFWNEMQYLLLLSKFPFLFMTDIFKSIFLQLNIYFMIKISHKFTTTELVGKMSAIFKGNVLAMSRSKAIK